MQPEGPRRVENLSADEFRAYSVDLLTALQKLAVQYDEKLLAHILGVALAEAARPPTTPKPK
jgi:hypothetical protein